MIPLIGIALILLLIAAFLIARAHRLHRATGLPIGQVVYGDTAAWNRVDRPLVSRRYGLVGKPDYLVEGAVDGRRVILPVEVKSRTKPSAPYAGHILQLATYCLLVEETYRIRPPFGLLHYADATVEIEFTEPLRNAVLAAAAEIRTARLADTVPRDHNDAGRCRQCGYRAACGEDALEGLRV